jgi:hypothetical protein
MGNSNGNSSSMMIMVFGMVCVCCISALVAVGGGVWWYETHLSTSAPSTQGPAEQAAKQSGTEIKNSKGALIGRKIGDCKYTIVDPTSKKCLAGQYQTKSISAEMQCALSPACQQSLNAKIKPAGKPPGSGPSGGGPSGGGPSGGGPASSGQVYKWICTDYDGTEFEFKPEDFVKVTWGTGAKADAVWACNEKWKCTTNGPNRFCGAKCADEFTCARAH